MLRTLQKRDLFARILMGFFIGAVAIMLVVTLVPGTVGVPDDPADSLAVVGSESITITEVRRQLQRVAGGRAVPPALEGLYARQILDQMVFERLIEMEARRMGIRVTETEVADRIKRMLPEVFSGDAFLGRDQYAAAVERYNMSIEEFEDLVRKSLLEDKFRRLVTDGLRVTRDELDREFRRRNLKVKIEYVQVRPEDLESRIAPAEADLAAYFEKHKERYALAERRIIRYALLDNSAVARNLNVSDAELRAYYQDHIDSYRVDNRARVSHILFKTQGKTDAEVQEIRKKAEGVLRKARSGAKFEDLAKQFSEDTTRDKGGDLGWIVAGQTVPEFEKVSFALAPGGISDLVQTQFGLHIIKVNEREYAHTKAFEQVRAVILPVVSAARAERAAADEAGRIAAAIRRTANLTIQDLARDFKLELGEAGPLASGEPVLALGGKEAEVEGEIFRLTQGQLSPPLRIERGYVVLGLKEVQPPRSSTLAEAREKVLADYRRERALEEARARGEEIARRAKAGEALAKIAKAVGLEAKTSEEFSQTGSVSGVGSARQLSAAFALEPGRSSDAISVGSNWVVLQVVSRQEPKPEEFAKQQKELEEAILQTKRSAAYEAFRESLEERMRNEGRYHINEQNLKRLIRSA
jgi:peptidyl-prolyl cis-trans isomerase D